MSAHVTTMRTQDRQQNETQTDPAADGRSLHQWRSIKGSIGRNCRKCSVTFSKCRDPERKPRAQPPTAMLEQMKELRRAVGVFLPDAGAEAQ